MVNIPRCFSLLVVDNKDEVRERARSTFASMADVIVREAATVEEAQGIANEHFIDVAFVDLHLVDRGDNADGLVVLRHLAENRPSCRRVLVTKYSKEYQREVFLLIHPLSTLINGAIDKYDMSGSYVDVALSLLEQWRSSTITISGLEDIYALLSDKLRAAQHPQITVEELYYLCRNIFCQAENGNPARRVRAVECTTLRGGRSQSIVILARPRNIDGHGGIWCVLKLGPLLDIHQEYLRYSEYVRFWVSLNRRVEMLGHATADSLGIIAYSFAGQSPSAVTTLENLIVEESPKAIDVLDAVFDPSRQEWYATTSSGVDQGNHFSRLYELDARQAVERASKILQNFAAKIGAVIKDHSMIFAGDKLSIPTSVIDASPIRGPYTRCVVHGDLHGGNIIVSVDDDRVFFIDYCDTGEGPAAADFAAMEGSIRLYHGAGSENLQLIGRAHRIEWRLWDSMWHRNGDWRGEMPYWAKVSARLVFLARQNFPSMSAGEYAATCFLWALRLLRINTLSEGERFRILVWLSHLNRVLERHSGG